MLSETLGSLFGAAVDENMLDGTQGSSSTDLLPPFGLNKTSHLPTPQSSPSNIAVYASELNGSYNSPVPSMSRDVQIGSLVAPRSLNPSRNEDAQVIVPISFMTPDSSPLLPRKIMPPMTPTAGPSSVPHTPVQGEVNRARSETNHTTVSVLSLAPAPIISTPVSSRSRGVTPLSRLSSPFQDRLSAAERRATKSKSRSPMPVDSSMPDMFSAPLSSPPPLATPIPQRALGGEIQRIHLQLVADRAERITETEARRPEYLVREKRQHLDADIPTLDELDAANATLGVTESPVKGRRLQLFQATSEETFEQSLLAGGYPGYGQSPAYKNGEPQTPVPSAKGRGGLSQRALQWLQQATPGQPGPSTIVAVETSSTEEPDWVPSEQEIRKRRRLDAFKDTPETKEPSSKLYPVEIKGRGRLLLNMPPEGAATQPDVPVKKRVNRRKKRRGGRRGQASDPQDDEVLQPNWLDSAFPWCLRTQERTHTEKLEEEERLKWIERFLDRESDSEFSEEDQELRPPLQSHENDKIAHRRGRGKMVPLRVNSQSAARATGEKNPLVPSDPADARAALLSKRSVRSLATRRKEAHGDEVDEVKCVGCQRGDDGSELVQCDECQTWYHLPCIGIRNVAELGREEDPWFCNKCLDIAPPIPLEPTFVPTDNHLFEQSARGDSFFLQNSLLESPVAHWDAEPPAPQTPVRGRADGGGSEGHTRTFSTRSSWGEASSRAGPSTPESSAKTVRVYDTPGPFALAFDRDGFDPETPFDPTTTPSRGIKFSGGPLPTLGLSTPKSAFGMWAAAGRGGQTPTPAKFGGAVTAATVFGGGAGRRRSWDDSGGAPLTSPYPRSIYSAAYDDTPVTRAPRLRERLSALNMGGRMLWETQGLVRPGSPTRVGEEMVVDREGEVPMETEA